MSATTPPRQRSTMRPVSVTRPITAKSSSHFLKIASASASRPGWSTISIRSCDSESIISYGTIPASRQGTSSIWSSMPTPPLLAISTEEEVRPAAPMSWMATIAPVPISSRHASISSFSVNGSPTCTVGRLASASSPKSADAMVAPWMPSRPVLEPTYTIGFPTPDAAE